MATWTLDPLTNAWTATVTIAAGVNVKVMAQDTADGVKFTLDVVSGYADLRGFFFDETETKKLSLSDVSWGDSRTVSTTAAKLYTSDNGSLAQAGASDNTMQGSGETFNAGVEFGTAGIGRPGDDISYVSFTVKSAAGGSFDFADLQGLAFGIRATSVGATEATRTGSVKYVDSFNHAAVLSSAAVELNETNAALTTEGRLTITDVDGAATFVAQANVAGKYGTFSIGTDGQWTFAANATFDGLKPGQSVTDTFQVFSADGTKTSVAVTIKGTNEVPVATASTASGNEDTTITGQVSGTDLEGSALTYKLVSPVEGLTLDANGSYSFKPPAHFFGEMTFQFVANDGWADSEPQSVTITVNSVNDAPTGTASATLAAGEEDIAYTISKADLLAGFSDVDGDSLSAENFGASQGTVTVNADGSITITQAANVNGAVSLTYDVVDGKGGKVAASQSFSLAAVNDAPELAASANSVSMAENEKRTGITLAPSDADGTTSFGFVLSGADKDLFTITNADGYYYLDFKQAPDFETKADAGADNVYNVSVAASDGAATSAPQSLAVTVTDVVENRAPTLAASAASANMAENQTRTGIVLTAVDPDGTSLNVGDFSLTGADASKFTLVRDALDLSKFYLDFQVAPDFEVKADAGANNVYDVTVAVSDGALSSQAHSLAVAVTDVYDVEGAGGDGNNNNIPNADLITLQQYNGGNADVVAGTDYVGTVKASINNSQDNDYFWFKLDTISARSVGDKITVDVDNVVSTSGTFNPYIELFVGSATATSEAGLTKVGTTLGATGDDFLQHTVTNTSDAYYVRVDREGNGLGTYSLYFGFDDLIA